MQKKWRYIDERDVSASYGLAVDEFLMHNVVREEYPFEANLRLYNYADYSALCGRFQNLQAEIDIDRCKALGYGVGRRLTGGGAIIMGRDQLGLCLTIPAHILPFHTTRTLYHLFARPVLSALKKMGITAGFKSKNDLEVGGKKIAGLGVHIDVAGSVQFHTSLLVDLDVLSMLEVLKIPIQKYDDRKKIFSVNQRMTTVRREADRRYEMAEIKQIIKEAFADAFDVFYEEKGISVSEKKQIHQLELDRYKNVDWLLQHSPQEDMTGMSLHKTAGGLLRTYIGLKGETIKSVLITGDFIGQVDLFRTIEARLKWAPLDAEFIHQTIDTAYTDYKGDEIAISQEDLAHAILLAARKAKTVLDYHYDGSCYYPKHKREYHGS